MINYSRLIRVCRSREDPGKPLVFMERTGRGLLRADVDRNMGRGSRYGACRGPLFELDLSVGLLPGSMEYPAGLGRRDRGVVSRRCLVGMLAGA